MPKSARQPETPEMIASPLPHVSPKLPCTPNTALLAAIQATALVSAYHDRWVADAYWRPCEVGGRFHLPLVNPDSGRPSRTFTHSGAYAGMVEVEGQPWLLEHRTTSDEIELPAAPFWQALVADSQSAGYLLAHERSGQPLAGVAYDIVRRPEIRPRLVPKGSAKRTAAENLGTLLEIEQGTYCGCPLTGSMAEPVDSAGRESLELYGMRVACDARQRPQWYFQRACCRATTNNCAARRRLVANSRCNPTGPPFWSTLSQPRSLLELSHPVRVPGPMLGSGTRRCSQDK